jgi:hypothetical protein
MRAVHHVDMPEDFPAMAAEHVDTALARHYRRDKRTIKKWREQCGVAPPRYLGVRLSVPESWATVAPRNTRFALRHAYGWEYKTMDRWAAETGIRPMTAPVLAIGGASRKFSPLNGGSHRDMSRVGQAVDFLRKYGPVVRCDVAGRYDPKGDRWRRGSTILSAPEIVERAERLGFDADAWKRVA